MDTTIADYEDFICQDLETVEELLPTAQLFVNTIEQMTNDWMASHV